MKTRHTETSSPGSGSALLVSCSRCGDLHRPANPLVFDPICARCAATRAVGASQAPRFHSLDERSIAAVVGETAPGSFVLGYLDGSEFTPFYLGRSDSDVGASLQTWVGAPSRPRRHAASPRDPWRSRSAPLRGIGTHSPGPLSTGIDTGYTHFAFCYATSAVEAFEQECRDYHELGGSANLDNACHPEPPADSPWACPLHG